MNDFNTLKKCIGTQNHHIGGLKTTTLPHWGLKTTTLGTQNHHFFGLWGLKTTTFLLYRDSGPPPEAHILTDYDRKLHIFTH